MIDMVLICHACLVISFIHVNESDRKFCILSIVQFLFMQRRTTKPRPL